MAVTFKCASCGQAMQAQDTSAGKSVKCPRCKETNRVPGEPLPEPEELLPAYRRQPPVPQYDGPQEVVITKIRLSISNAMELIIIFWLASGLLGAILLGALWALGQFLRVGGSS